MNETGENTNLGSDKEVTVSGMNRELRRRLNPIYGSGEAEAMIRLIWYALKKWDNTALAINFDTVVSRNTVAEIDRILYRLEKHEPIQYILGTARFYGMNFKVTPDVLIPRPETAELIDIIVADNKGSDLKVLDIGTGSGAIAIALARNLNFPVVTALDVSEKCLEVAKYNAKALNVAVRMIHADIFKFDCKQGEYDLIVSNPPYIARSEAKDMEDNVLKYEPESALFVPDDDPLCYYDRIADVALNGLNDKGRLYFEINPLYADRCVGMMKDKGFGEVELFRDSFGRNRFMTGKKIGDGSGG